MAAKEATLDRIREADPLEGSVETPYRLHILHNRGGCA